jgi:hypothetical protein
MLLSGVRCTGRNPPRVSGKEMTKTLVDQPGFQEERETGFEPATFCLEVLLQRNGTYHLVSLHAVTTRGRTANLYHFDSLGAVTTQTIFEAPVRFS